MATISPKSNPNMSKETMPQQPQQPQSNPSIADLINALAEFENVKANKINPAFKAKYVSLDALLEAIKPVLHKYNLALIQNLVSDENEIGVETSFIHATGISFKFGKLMVNVEGKTAQQIGGALTYIRRQSIQTACGISVDQDDDGNRASGTPITSAAKTVTQTYIPNAR